MPSGIRSCDCEPIHLIPAIQDIGAALLVVERSSKDPRWSGSDAKYQSRQKREEEDVVMSSGEDNRKKRRNDDSSREEHKRAHKWPSDEESALSALDALRVVAVSANIDAIAKDFNTDKILKNDGLRNFFDSTTAVETIISGIASAEHKRKAAAVPIDKHDDDMYHQSSARPVRVPDLETIMNPGNYSQGNEVWWQHTSYGWSDHEHYMRSHKSQSDTRKRTVILRSKIHNRLCDIVIIAAPPGPQRGQADENYRYFIEIEAAPKLYQDQAEESIPNIPLSSSDMKNINTTTTNANENVALEALNEVLSLTDENEVFEHTARIVLHMTGFERIMIYNFDARGEEYDGYGEVVAEAIADAEPGKEPVTSYLHMKFPASDVPSQARKLYKRTQVRSIVDVESKPIPLVLADDQEGIAVDLSDTRLRYTSPIHLVYLKNMGVRASASSSIVIGNRLVGLIACHDTRGPRPISTSVWKWLSLIGSHTSMAITAIRANKKAQLISAIQSKKRSSNIADTFNLIAQPAIDYLQSAFAIVIAPSHFTVPSGREVDEDPKDSKNKTPQQVVECVGQATKEEVDLCVYVLQQVAKAEGTLSEAKFHFIEDLADPSKSRRFLDPDTPSAASKSDPLGSTCGYGGSVYGSAVSQQRQLGISTGPNTNPNQKRGSRSSPLTGTSSVPPSPTTSIMSLNPARVQLSDSVLWGGNEMDLATMAEKLKIGGIATIVTTVFIVGFVRRTVPKNVRYGGAAAVAPMAGKQQEPTAKRRKGRGEPAFAGVAEDAVEQVSNSLLPRRSFEEFNLVHGSYSPAWSFEDREIVHYLGSWLVQASVYFAVAVERDRALANESMARNFLANMSHELRTPFNGVVGMLSILIEDEALRDDTRRMLRVVNRSAECMLLLLDDILTISKLENKEFKIIKVSFSIQTVLSDLCELFRSRCTERSISLEYYCEVVNEVDHPSIPMLISDGGRIRQVLVNLISNAIKFSNPYSSVTVQISLHSSERRSLIKGDIEREHLKNANSHRPLPEIFREIDQAIESNIQLGSQDNESLWLLATIKDRGIGISQEAMSKLFRRFSQVDDSKTKQYQGTGLGLAICEHLIHLLGGRIWCFSTNGKNEKDSKSCFQFIIPVLADVGATPVSTTAFPDKGSIVPIPPSPKSSSARPRNVSSVGLPGSTTGTLENTKSQPLPFLQSEDIDRDALMRNTDLISASGIPVSLQKTTEETDAVDDLPEVTMTEKSPKRVPNPRLASIQSKKDQDMAPVRSVGQSKANALVAPSQVDDSVTQAQIQKFQQAAIGTGLRSNSMPMPMHLPISENMLEMHSAPVASRPTSLVPSLPPTISAPLIMKGNDLGPGMNTAYQQYHNATIPYQNQQQYPSFSAASPCSSVSNTPQMPVAPGLPPYYQQQGSMGPTQTGPYHHQHYQSLQQRHNVAALSPQPPTQQRDQSQDTANLAVQQQQQEHPATSPPPPPKRISPLDLAKLDEEKQLTLAMSNDLPIILCADDIENNRAVMAVMLQHLKGFHCMLSEHGLAALNAWNQFSTRIKAIILDWHMPVMDGIEAARQIRASPGGRDIPLILVTADIMPRDEHDMKLLFNHVVIKPVTRSKILHMLPKS